MALALEATWCAHLSPTCGSAPSAKKKSLQKSDFSPSSYLFFFFFLPSKVQSFGERIVLFILNVVIFGRLERRLDDDDVFFLPHSGKEEAKVLWRDGAAVGFYTTKAKGEGHRVPSGGLPARERSLSTCGARRGPRSTVVVAMETDGVRVFPAPRFPLHLQTDCTLVPLILRLHRA